MYNKNNNHHHSILHYVVFNCITISVSKSTVYSAIIKQHSLRAQCH